MLTGIEKWVEFLKKRKFGQHEAANRSRIQRCYNLLGGDGSILEVFEGNRYLRICAITVLGIKHTFSVLEYRSDEHPEKPKTDFYSGDHDSNFRFMTEEEIEMRFFSSPA